MTPDQLLNSCCMYLFSCILLKLLCFLQQKEERDRSEAETKSDEKTENTESVDLVLQNMLNKITVNLENIQKNYIDKDKNRQT